MEKKMSSMRISPSNKRRLAEVGNASDSLDDVLGRVLDVYEEIKSERLLEEKIR